MIKLSNVILKSGSHKDAEHGMCVMEAVSYFASEPFSDRPKCACPILTSYMITLNDRMTDDERQLLKPYIKRLIGTRDGNAQKRANVLSWASITVFTPHCLELIGLSKESNALKSIKKFDWNTADSAADSAARSAARSAASAARSAANAADSAAYSAASAAEKKARRTVIDMALTALNEALNIKD